MNIHTILTMNFSKYKKLLMVPILLLMGSCGGFVEDINVSPNNSATATPSVLLPNVLAGAGFANNGELNRFASVLMNYLAGAGGSPAAYDIFNTNGADFGNQWRFDLYGGTLINAQKLIEVADQSESKMYTGIGKIMKAYAFSMATDIWGDVPYSQALQGEAMLQPRLDKQEDIYKGNQSLGIQSLFDLVREGLTDLEAASALKPTTDDIIYGGNLDNWKRAGNTMLLKFANTISRREPELAKQVITEVLTKNMYITSNAQDMNVKFGSSVGSTSAIWNLAVFGSFSNELIMSTRFLEVLRPDPANPAKTDPRLPVFFTKPAADYVTIDNGYRGALPTPTNTWSRYAPYVTGQQGEGPVRLLTNFQRAFILAESALTLGTPGDPQTLYTEGITASMKLAGISDADIAAYLAANPNVATLTGTTQQKLEQIITQKWIAWTGNGLESWNDWRRTGYPRLTASQNAVGINGTRPVRAAYVTQEIERNPGFPNPGPQSNERVWWDVD
ncbi:SusD-like starch-binding protein associating with outer membrane [Larkinella arboricola]|uniref:SusD-like starch-binding protein associating with outer membrane n=1 Tax=Larkinella arboricola TaxID=643671 RepID=A0A327X8J3_LARAB|nr:SusD/RagB family nutrient-binding outer membrane lipoprotein [Larkinella arboricola]RAK03245.1 SusD-like starch-binding protein associating with outer membrane [Larkinella arboricola]